MTRVFRTLLLLGVIGLVAVGGIAIWAAQATSGDFAFVPRAAQPAIGVVELEGAAAPPPGAGRVYFTTVGVRHATVWETWFGVDGGTLVPQHAVQPKGETDEDRNRMDTLQMDDSQQAAEVVALRALGERVTVRPIGVIIAAIDRDAPIARSGARLGDAILTVDGRRTLAIEALRSAVRQAGVDTTVDLGLHRDGKLLTVATRTIRSPSSGRPILGILPAQANDVQASRTVTYTVEGVGGPSAGLAFALQIYSAGKGYANLHGRKVAATGSLSMTGEVGAIGGVEEKAVGARRAGAEILLVPRANAAAARTAGVSGLKIIPVGTFDDAVAALDAAA